MKKQSGFTLIELIIVIVILGILAVTAAPQFFNFGSDARESTVRGMEGSVKAAADLVYARSAIDGVEQQSTAGDASEDEIVVAYGYPEASENGIIAALNASFGAGGDWVFAEGEEGTEDVPAVRIGPFGFNDYSATTDYAQINACYVQYIQATAAERAQITAVLTGC